MENREILSHIDHTLLSPCASWTDIQKLCREALTYQTASVCIPPVYVARVRKAYPSLTICTVVGFPLGYSTTQAKEREVLQALEDGCDEIDMVINLSDVKNGQISRVREEICRIRQVCQSHVLKVIVETCYLTREEKIALCHAVTEAGADYIKTSTGFGPGGATLEDVRLFAQQIGPHVKIKAAGGIRTREELEAFLEAGCDRIGASSAVQVLTQQEAGE